MNVSVKDLQNNLYGGNHRRLRQSPSFISEGLSVTESFFNLNFHQFIIAAAHAKLRHIFQLVQSFS